MVYKINKSLSYISESLKKSRMVKMTSKGIWEALSSVHLFAIRICGLEERHWRKTSKQFREILDQIESIPVQFSEGGEKVSQDVDYQVVIATGLELLRKLSSFTSSKTVKEIFSLRREFIALSYRLEGVNGGFDPSSASEELLDELVAAARSWKASSKIFNEEDLTPSELKILKQTSRYVEFVHLLLSDHALLSLFFSWSLRDLLPIRPFIEFPSLSGKVLDSGLSGRIGRIGGHLLNIHKACHSGIIEKIVTLPVEGKPVSVLDESKYVILQGNYALTIGEIFNIFRNKATDVGNVEFMRDGIVNWNTFNWGRWDADKQEHQLIDLSQEEWWKDLPLQEVLTLKQARKKFGEHLDGRQWNFSTISTRESKTLDYEKSHAYTSIAIPLENGHYAVYAFGKYATWLPSTYLEGALSFGHTGHATIAYPDENIYYTHRQKARYSFALSEEEGLKYMAAVKHDTLLSREGHFSYQITSDNCAKWSYEKIQQILGVHRVPNIFQVPFLDSEPFGFMAAVFAIVKSLPKAWQVPIATFFHRPFKAAKGMWIIERGRYLWKALTHHTFWEDTIIYLPAMLHRQQEVGMIDRFVPQGVTFTIGMLKTSYHRWSHKMVQLIEYAEEIIYRGIKSIIALAKEGRALIATLNTQNQFLPSDDHSSLTGGSKKVFALNKNSTQVTSLGMVHALA